MATQPTLNSGNLPYPDNKGGYEEEVFYKGSVRRMASGALVRDIVTSSNHQKLRFTLTWTNRTISERSLVDTALGYLYDGTARTFLSPRNQSYTVVLAEGGEPAWQMTGVANNGTALYTGTLVLEEV